MAAAKEETHRRPRLDFPGYAQEFLRRSPDYCSQYARLIAQRDAASRIARNQPLADQVQRAQIDNQPS